MSGTGVAGGEPLTKRAKQTPPRLGDADAPRRDTSITVATVMRAQEAGGGDGSASEQLGAGLRHLPHQDQHGHHVAWAAGVEDQQRNGHSPQPPSGGRDMAPARRRTASVSDPRANHAALVAAAAAAAAAETSGGKQGEEEEGDLTEEEERARQSQLRNLMKRPSFGHILNTLRQGKEELALRHDDANQPNAAVATDSQPIKAEASQTAAVRPLGPTTTPGPHGSPGSQMQANHARVAVQAVQAVSAAAVSGLPPQHMQSSPPVRHPPFQSPPAGGPAPVHKGQVQQPLQFQPQRVPQPMRQPAQHPPKNASPNAQMVAGGAMQPVAHGMAPQAFGLHPALYAVGGPQMMPYQQPTVVVQGQMPQPDPNGRGGPSPGEDKKVERLKKNALAAKKIREKKKEHLGQLEAKVKTLEDQNAELQRQLAEAKRALAHKANSKEPAERAPSGADGGTS